MNEMGKKKENKEVDINELFEGDTWSEDRELTGYTKEIFDNLQEMPVEQRITTILDVLSHDDDLFQGVSGRFAYETGYALRTAIKKSGCSDGMNKDEAYMLTCATFGKKLFEYGDEAMERFFKNEFKDFEKRLKKKSE